MVLQGEIREMMTMATTATAPERVWCETPYHGPKTHPLSWDCTWPHLAGPSAASPSATAMRDLDGHGNLAGR